AVASRRKPMNTTKRTAIFAIALLAAVTTRAQTETDALASNTSVGVLGRQYADVSFGAQDIRRVSPNFYDTTIEGNVPITRYLDLAARYSYGGIRENIDGRSNGVSTRATLYTTYNGVKPFFSAGLGHEWARAAGGFRDNFGFWGLAAGVEIPAGIFSVTPQVSYIDDFDNGESVSRATTYAVEGNYWY